MGMLLYALLLVFPFAMAFAAASDLLTMTIPNRLSVGLVLAFFIIAPAAGLSWQEILAHAGVGAAMLVAGFAMFAMGWVGGGDAKLLAAASLWLGMDPMVLFLAYATVFGGVLAVAILIYRSFPADALPLPEWAARLHVKGGAIPYGVAIAAGALTVYPTTQWFAALQS
jgi:prepilin peptidase CpaA